MTAPRYELPGSTSSRELGGRSRGIAEEIGDAEAGGRVHSLGLPASRCDVEQPGRIAREHWSPFHAAG
jgi:hypothetical protein